VRSALRTSDSRRFTTPDIKCKLALSRKMSNTNPTNLPSTAPSFAFQGSHQLITNPLVISRRPDTGSYTPNGLYKQQFHRSLRNFQKERQYILHAKNRGAMDALSAQQPARSSPSQSPGGFLSLFPNDGSVGVSSVPLSRTESCPLPGPASGKSQVMRRQHSVHFPSLRGGCGIHDGTLSLPAPTAIYLFGS